MRNIISYFIKYPVAVNVIIFAFILFGLFGAASLTSSFFPLVPSKIITININYPGASPKEIEEGIVLQIEDNIKGLVGIDRVTSESKENTGLITIELEKGRDIDVSLAEVKNAVDRVPSYPTGMEPLIVAKKEETRETISFSVSGNNIPLVTLKSISREIENDLRKMSGVSQIEISGYPDEEIEVAVRENDLLAYQISFQEIADMLSNENILITGGNVKTPNEEYLIRANNRAYHSDELDNMVLRMDSNGNTIRLKDVATVRDVFSESPNASFYNFNPSITISINNTNDEDLISTAEKINKYIEEFNQKNNNVQLNVVRDSSITLTQRTKLLAENAIMGMTLVFFFLALFLNPHIAIWVAFGLPISFFGMFIFAPMVGVTINVLSLFGMIIVIGILVDDGIVIAENIYRHYEEGKNPIDAAIDGTLEVIPPVISAIITTLLAFSIFMFLEGRIGEFFSEVSVIVTLTLAVSLLEALIILPAHVAHSKALHRANKNAAPPKGFYNKTIKKFEVFNQAGDKILNFLNEKLYSKVLRFSLRNPFIMLSIFLGAFIITVGSIGGGIIRTAFFPSVASDKVQIVLKMPEGTNLDITDSIASYIEKKAWKVNEDFTQRQTGNKSVFLNIIKTLGPGTANATLDINLLPGEERDFLSADISNAIRDSVGTVSGAENLAFGSGNNFGGSPISISFVGNKLEDLKAAKDILKEELKKIEALKDITDKDPAGIKEISIQLKNNAYALGLNTQIVMGQVRAGFFGVQAQRFQRGQDEIKVWVRYDRPNRTSIKYLDDMRIVTPSGQKVPLKEIADYKIERGEISIFHLDNQREIQVNADLKHPSYSANDILEDIKRDIIPKIQAQYPSVGVSYEGQSREANKVQKSAKSAFPIILFLIYATMAFTFRSYSQPFILLIMVPLSLIGVAWGHWIHGFPVNILSWLGIIALIGIMVNDGLVFIARFNSFLTEGVPFEEALYESGRSRFRAIFLTSITTIGGLAPLIFETSRQAQFLIPMAISIAYGIGIATFLTLLILPILLMFSNSLKVNVKWLITGIRVPKEEVERAIIELRSEEAAIHKKNENNE